MKNLKTIKFAEKCNEIKQRSIISLKEKFNKAAEDVNSIELISFSNEKPLKINLKNKITFTYNDAYRGNSSTYMSIEELHHPHTYDEDRGYIKGVATDLNGYLKLRSISNINHYFQNTIDVYTPHFRSSKNQTLHYFMCDEIVKKTIKELDQLQVELFDELNKKLKEKTNCSLLYYVQNI